MGCRAGKASLCPGWLVAACCACYAVCMWYIDPHVCCSVPPPRSYTMLEDAPLVYDSSTLLASILSDYVTVSSPVDIAAQGRIINCAQNATDPLCTAAAPAAAPAPSSASGAAGVGSWARLVAAAVVMFVLTH